MGQSLHDLWSLDPGVTFLNHGSFGACPRAVLAAQEHLRARLEAEPVRFLVRELEPLLEAARAELARFLGARPDDLAFVANATTGVNAVLRSIALGPGDEILLTDHNYGATLRVAQFVARERGGYVRTVTVPYPRFDPAQLVDAVATAITPRTRVAVLDHITSESALVFPLAELAAVCRTRGVAVLVDGAHAPGVLPLDLQSLGADWYSANLHKWACSPRSCGILWAAPDRQRDLHPPVISWGLDQGFTAEFDWVGTRDVSPWLAAPAGFEFLAVLGIDNVWRHNHDLAWTGAQRLADRWGTSLGYRESGVGFMATIPLPPRLGATPPEAARLRDALLFRHQIEVQLHAAHGQLWTRISAQVYNDLSDVERLGEAVIAQTR